MYYDACVATRLQNHEFLEKSLSQFLAITRGKSKAIILPYVRPVSLKTDKTIFHYFTSLSFI